MPYYCIYDTERTFKNPMKVIIDPLKEKYCLDIRLIDYDLELNDALREFCNIAFRKFAFELEIHHLTTVLLFFLYINKDRKLNSLTKEITSDEKLNIFLELDSKESNESKNRQNKAGNLFEILCYGEIQNELTLKQLLFIVNENNDNLDYKSFKEEYKKHSEKDLNEILNEFPNNQLFSEHVKTINELKKKKKMIFLLKNY